MKSVAVLVLIFTAIVCITANNGTDSVPPKIVHRIVNGAKADAGQFPYQATILIRTSHWGGYRYIPVCGATIISERWLLTAGHCSLGFDRRYDLPKLRVVIGVHKLNHDDRIMAEVKNFYPHEGFRMTPVVSNDIGLVELKEPLPLSENGIVAAKLPSNGQRFSGSGITSGHGLMNPRNVETFSEHLLWLDIKVQDDRVCQSLMIYRFGQMRFNPSTMICATAATGKSPCMGDSGGPLVQKTADGESTVFGVVSFGPRNCGQIGVPFVFTKVSAFRDWIRGISRI